MMAIAILMAGLSGLVTGWLLTSVSAAKELRRKHAEWQAEMERLRRVKLLDALEVEVGGAHLVNLVSYRGGKTGGDAA